MSAASVKTQTASQARQQVQQPAALATSSIPAPANETRPGSESNETFIQEGKSNAITVNLPFTTIPGLPALSSILKKLDKTTKQDLGFTVKPSTAQVTNQTWAQDLQLNVDYAGFGWKSSKFNFQYSPVSKK